MSLIKRGVSKAREDGVRSFLDSAHTYLRRKVMLYRGVMTLPADPTNTRFVVDEAAFMSKNLTRFREERRELSEIIEELKDGDVFYDVGANTGLYSCIVANSCDQCRVVAFEPYPPNITKLIKNVKLNGLEHISIVETALSDTSGTTPISTPEEPTPGHGTSSITDELSDMSVPTARGDELITKRQMPPPNIVKIDVEGAEPLVVDGLATALSEDRCRLVLCELHPPDLSEYGSSVSGMREKFEALGFSVELHDRWGDAYVLKARRT